MVKPQISSYERIRQERLAENKKRMEDLNLTKLAQLVRNVSPKPSPMKQVKPRTPRNETTIIQVRRSPRVANQPAPVYKEFLLDTIERSGRYVNKRRDLSNRVYASSVARMNSIERAEELESKLENGFPSFVKPMLPSHVSGGFWMGLPRYFCKKHLPKRDDTITLVNEHGDEWPTVYLAQKTGLSGGWMGFSRAHNLVDGDALVFELIKPTVFKIHIVKVDD